MMIMIIVMYVVGGLIAVLYGYTESGESLQALTGLEIMAIGQGFSQIGGLFKKDPFKASRKEAQQRFFQVTQPKLEAGIPENQILRLNKVVSRGITPLVNSVFAKGKARFGSRSGIAAGAAVSAGTSAIGQFFAELFGKKIFSDREDLRASARGLTAFGTRQGGQA